MSLLANNRRKRLNLLHPEKNKHTTKHTETKNGISNKSSSRETTDAVRKTDASMSSNTQRKPDAEKSLSSDPQEKAAGEFYVHECKEFAGVTVIIRTTANPKALGGNLDGYAKGGMHGSRRRSEFQQAQLNMQDKLEHGDKIDHSGGNHSLLAPKSEVSTSNSHETSSQDN